MIFRIFRLQELVQYPTGHSIAILICATFKTHISNMRFTPLSLASLTCWSLLYNNGAAKESKGPTGALQIDLVFPRNETYNPSPVMPIIFSYRNLGLVPYLIPSITYEIWNNDNFSADSAGGRVEVPLVNDSSVDPHIEFHKYIYPFNTEGTWRLNFHIRWIRCYVAPAERGRGELNMAVVNETDVGGIVFSTKGPSKQVDLVAATSNKNCSYPAGATINVTDTMRYPGTFRDYEPDVCPMVEFPEGNADSCDVMLDPATASSIDAEMTSWVCTRVWETNRPKGFDCESRKEKESTAMRIITGGASFLAFMLGVLVYVYNLL
ncbi:hypothetical protein HG530_012604 [Fusarium avenaceum]|nr:hypothetical protein HG530_012604 [Fusarium avenaceum]